MSKTDTQSSTQGVEVKNIHKEDDKKEGTASKEMARRSVPGAHSARNGGHPNGLNELVGPQKAEEVVGLQVLQNVHVCTP